MTEYLAKAMCLWTLVAVGARNGLGAAPELRLASIVGDARGKGIDIVHVATDETGRVLALMRGGRLAVFDRDGAYLKSIRVPKGVSWSSYLAVRGRRVLVGDYRTDFPWAFADRRQGSEPGRFSNPGPVVAGQNRIFVSDGGNKRIQIFSRENTEDPISVLKLETRPVPLSVNGKRLLVADDQRNLFVYDMKAGGYERTGSLRIRDGAVSLCMGLEQSIYVAYRRGQDHSLREYVHENGQWSERRAIAPSLYGQWPAVYLHPAPLVKGPDSQLWFGADTHGAVLSLDPATDRVTVRVRGVHRPVGIGFDTERNLYVGGYCPPGKKGPAIHHFTADRKALGVFGPLPLYEERHAPVWALLPDRDGGVHVRVVEGGYRKGWPAFTLKKLHADGTAKTFLDLGSLYAVRTRFHPSSSTGNLMFDHDGNIILAAAMHLSVMKLSPDGQVLWEASQYPRNADEVPFGRPVDVAVDSRNNIWVADAGRHTIICLSSEGKALMTYGRFAGIDDVRGKGFNRPTGIATVTSGNQEYLVVGDSGNHRFVKYHLSYADAKGEN
ncbi:MAG: hypothetical protein QF437_13685 [Planctomycetota bacterium]|nr:hypothetical protein [Planctomycetota bacterium]MDP7131541.1 hypothetical protein [Planctomycetota bacterium]